MRTSEFARAAGLSVDTVRFYVRQGLLAPETTSLGGRNPYNRFTEADVVTVRFIRFSQSLGLSLEEIASLNAERRNGGVARDRSLEIMHGRLAKLEEKLAEYGALADYLRAKILWQERGGQGAPPTLQAIKTTRDHAKDRRRAR